MYFLSLPGELGSWRLTLGFVIVLGVGGLGFYLIKRYREGAALTKRADRNNYGRSMKIIRDILASYIKRSDGRVIYSIEVGSSKTKGSADALLIGYFGILVLVGCDYSGELYVGEADSYMTQVVGKERRRHENPVLTAKTAEKAVAELLREKKVYKVPVESAVVFTGKKVSANVSGSVKGYSPGALRKALKSEKFLEDKGVDTDAAAEAILSWR